MDIFNIRNQFYHDKRPNIFDGIVSDVTRAFDDSTHVVSYQLACLCDLSPYHTYTYDHAKLHFFFKLVNPYCTSRITVLEKQTNHQLTLDNYMMREVFIVQDREFASDFSDIAAVTGNIIDRVNAPYFLNDDKHTSGFKAVHYYVYDDNREVLSVRNIWFAHLLTKRLLVKEQFEEMVKPFQDYIHEVNLSFNEDFQSDEEPKPTTLSRVLSKFGF